jgi:predicted O-methyltransferase YrrM
MVLDRALTIDGWMSGLELEWLAQTAKDKKVIIEVGSFKGRSTRALADNTNGTIYAVDLWDGARQLYEVYNPNSTDEALVHYIVMHQNGTDQTQKEFESNLSNHILSGRVIIVRDVFTNMYVHNPDFIFIDAIHEYQALKDDVAHALRMMKSGILSGHDYHSSWPGVIQAVDELFPDRELAGSIWYTQI